MTGVRRMHDFGESLADALIEIDGRLPPGDESQNVEITGPAWARLLELAQDQAHADAGWKQAIDLALSEKSDKELEGPWTVNERARELRRRVVAVAESVLGGKAVEEVFETPPPAPSALGRSFEAVPAPKTREEKAAARRAGKSWQAKAQKAQREGSSTVCWVCGAGVGDDTGGLGWRDGTSPRVTECWQCKGLPVPELKKKRERKPVANGSPHAAETIARHDTDDDGQIEIGGAA